MALPKVTHARVESFLTGEGLNFGRDDDDDIVVGFDGLTFFITVQEDLLRVSGWWHAELTDDDAVGRALAAANALNQDLVAPKTVIGGTRPSIIFENALKTTAGRTDEQLGAFLVMSLRTSFMVAERLATDLPDLAPAAEESPEEEN
ncbi:YbjN domain-containing protein [Corynebacterium meridianum]|uniref:YbjN domain-containing protein n=1 Tax=Corynebacterium meridianum TaxID=2765363 RepID=A0A934M7E4_9CORY|nr:YbjN domain-containing protein [Corynebacterium meridianum]MBI8989452.1 YbjN domain-containing protein [Corynebacterium meridianum]MCK7677473.1 YbjN domain-containing protein [Corynebacterium meridianum]